jgi:hypothetical protein
VNSPPAPAFPRAFGPHIAIPIRPTHLRQLFVNAANAASRVDSSGLLVTFVAVAGTYELTNNSLEVPREQRAPLRLFGITEPGLAKS